jgi:hypothetical protein
MYLCYAIKRLQLLVIVNKNIDINYNLIFTKYINFQECKNVNDKLAVVVFYWSF